MFDAATFDLPESYLLYAYRKWAAPPIPPSPFVILELRILTVPILGTIMPNMGILKKPPLTKAAGISNARGKANTTKSTRTTRIAGAGATTGAPLTVREAGAAYQVPASQTSPLARGLADALFTTTQQRVLGLLIGLPGRSFFANELIGLTGSGSGAVQRELARLESSGLVSARWIGNQKHYQANQVSPIFLELSGIVQKTFGLAGPLQEALKPLADRIRAAFVFGSVAKKEDSAASDIDVMVISDSLTYADLFAALESVTTRLGRTVNPTVLSWEDLSKRSKDGNAFVVRVLKLPKIWLIGTESDLGV